MSKYRPVNYNVYGYSSWSQFWSQNNPDGKAPRTDKKGKYPPKKPRAEYKKDVLAVLEAIHKENPVMDYDGQKAKLEKDIRGGDK